MMMLNGGDENIQALLISREHQDKDLPASTAVDVGRNNNGVDNEFTGIVNTNKRTDEMISFDAGINRPQTTTVLVNDNDFLIGYGSQSAVGQRNFESIKASGTAGTTVCGGIDVTPQPNEDQESSFQ